MLVEMAVEACVVQLLVTGFVHADPHEGNLRCAAKESLGWVWQGMRNNNSYGIY